MLAIKKQDKCTKIKGTIQITKSICLQIFLFLTILKEDVLLRPKPIINLNHCLTDNALHKVPASSKNTFAVIESLDV